MFGKASVAMTIQKRVCPVCFSYLTSLYIQDILYYMECLALLKKENDISCCHLLFCYFFHISGGLTRIPITSNLVKMKGGLLSS